MRVFEYQTSGVCLAGVSVAVALALVLASSVPSDAKPRAKRATAAAAAADVSAKPKRRVAGPAGPAANSGGDEWHYGSSSIVVDGNTGRVLQESNADALRHPASVTKVMTLFLLFEQIEAGRLALDSELPVSARASAQAPSKLGLKPGSTIAVEDAIKALVTKSANDVASVIAEAIGGTESEFAAQMTRKARALGMARTTFRNASGLPDPDQLTTARDLALLGRAIQDRFPRHYRYFGTRSFAYRGSTMANHNRLLGRLEGVDGIKTGYTRASGFNLLTSVRKDGRHLIAVVLGGRSGGARDTQMAGLISGTLPRAYAGARTAPRAVEMAEAARPRPAPAGPPTLPAPRPAGEPMNLDGFLTAATSAPPAKPAPGSTEPLRPNPVRVVAVGPPGPGAPLGTITVSQGQPPSGSGAQRSAPVVFTLASVPPSKPAAPSAPIAATDAPAPALPAATPATAAPAPSPPAGPAGTAGQRGDWMIQIGAFPAETQARDRLKAAQVQARTVLASADPFTEKVVKGAAALYRARFAGLDQERAQEACKLLKKSDFVCMPLRN